MITCRLYREGMLEEEAFDPTRASDLIVEHGSRVWLDIADPNEGDLELLQEEFSLHPLAIEDARHRYQRPKVEVYEGYVFLAMHAVWLNEGDDLQDSEIHAFAGHRYLITLRYPPVFEVSEVLRRWDRQPQLTHHGGGFLLYALLDEVVDGYLDVIDRLEDVADGIEDRVFADEPDQDVQEDIFHTKRKVVEFRRLVVPLRKAIDVMQEQPGFVPPELGPYYRDVADHLIRSIEFADNIRDLLTTALEAQLAQVSNRLNVIMKQLTSWAAIILIPTLIAGIYGMNFDHMPELSWHYGYVFALGVMVVSMFLLYRAFKKRDWL